MTIEPPKPAQASNDPLERKDAARWNSLKSRWPDPAPMADATIVDSKDNQSRVDGEGEKQARVEAAVELSKLIARWSQWRETKIQSKPIWASRFYMPFTGKNRVF